MIPVCLGTLGKVHRRGMFGSATHTIIRTLIGLSSVASAPSVINVEVREACNNACAVTRSLSLIVCG